MDISNAIVVGGGIGGLAVAVALARAGVAVTLLEKAPALTEVGAGLQISPNGLAVLRDLGLEGALTARGAVQARAVVLRNGERDRTVSRLDLGRLSADQRYLFVHRADLVAVLAAAARRANVSVELGQSVAALRPGALPEITLATGGVRRAELVVAADGIHSAARGRLNGAGAARFAGQIAWRAVVPNVTDHAPVAQVSMGAGRHLVSYPLREGRVVNLVAVEERGGWAAEDWNHADDPETLRTAFAGFTGAAAALLGAVEEVTLWGLHLHPVAEVWHEGGIALLGDAAHPTLPFLAQGANMALEDAWVLADCIRRLPLAQALPAYQARRIDRVRRVIRAAEGNAWKYHLGRGPVRALAHAGLGLGGRVAPGRMLGAFDWLYRHDVTAQR